MKKVSESLFPGRKQLDWFTGEVLEEVGQRWVETVTHRVPVDSRVFKRTLSHSCPTFVVQRARPHSNLAERGHLSN